MFRTSDIVLIAVMVSAAASTYKIKQQAETRFSAVRKIEQQIRFEEDTIDLLKADWSLLTQPARLQKLAETYDTELALKPVDAHQIVGLGDVPAKPIETPDQSGEQGSSLAQNGKDPTVTSGVKR